MRIHRSRPESGYVQIPNDTLRDPRLSYLARGVLAEILSRPDDWSTNADQTSGRARRERGKAGEGRDTLRRVYAELEAGGYLHRRLGRTSGGQLATRIHVFDAPVDAAVASYLLDDVSAGRTDDGTGSPRCDQGKHGSSQVAPTPDLPGVGAPGVGAPGVGAPGVNTKTADEDLTTNTDLRTNDDNDEDNPGVLTSPVQMEGNGHGEVKSFDFFTRDGTDQARQAQHDALNTWLRDNPEANVTNSVTARRSRILLGDGQALCFGDAADMRATAELLRTAAS